MNPRSTCTLLEEASRNAVPAVTNPPGTWLGGILSPKTFQFHMSWRRALFIPGQRVLLCPPSLPCPCPSAALLSWGDLDEGGAVQPGR